MRAASGTGSSEPAAHFGGFPPDTLRYLRDLRENNEKSWFEAHRGEYERLYVEPARTFVTAAGELLAGLAPAIRAEPRILGSIFRINRDTRFGADKRPYKDHIDFWFWEGARARAVSGFFLRLSPDFVGLGAGSHGFDGDQLERFRKALTRGETAGELTAAASSLEAAGYRLSGEHYARTPRGYEAASPRAAMLLRHRALFVHQDLPVEEALDGARLLASCRRQWSSLAPLHRWLVDNVQAAG
ncbi:MAG: DUF2461 domain-containing protein [Candidatus Dormibacteraeota bacterium]|nr:DUF2461 domain-containing protein [Candidatus Dormibacteraeota bacterium]